MKLSGVQRSEILLSAIDETLETRLRDLKDRCDQHAIDGGRRDAGLITEPEIPHDVMGSTLRVCQRHGLKVAIDLYGRRFVDQLFVDAIKLLREVAIRYEATHLIVDGKAAIADASVS